jgi:hypothetical protein
VGRGNRGLLAVIDLLPHPPERCTGKPWIGETLRSPLLERAGHTDDFFDREMLDENIWQFAREDNGANVVVIF